MWGNYEEKANPSMIQSSLQNNWFALLDQQRKILSFPTNGDQDTREKWSYQLKLMHIKSAALS